MGKSYAIKGIKQDLTTWPVRWASITFFVSDNLLSQLWWGVFTLLWALAVYTAGALLWMTDCLEHLSSSLRVYTDIYPCVCTVCVCMCVSVWYRQWTHTRTHRHTLGHTQIWKGTWTGSCWISKCGDQVLAIQMASLYFFFFSKDKRKSKQTNHFSSASYVPHLFSLSLSLWLSCSLYASL